MNKWILLTFGLAGLLVWPASAQTTLVNSWENSVEGWGSLQTNWTSGGFSTTTGVTQGSHSWTLNAATDPDYGAALGGTASTTLTLELANAASVSVDVLATGFSYMQWDLTLNQSGGLGYQSTDGYNYTQSPTIDTESTLTFSIPESFRTTLAASPTLPTSLNFQIGGGNGGTVYMDNLRITAVPEPTTFALFGLGALSFVLFRRHRDD